MNNRKDDFPNKSSTTSGTTHSTMDEGGREFGRVHEPTQAQQASRNQGLTDNQSAPNSGQKMPNGRETELKRAREGERRTA